MQGLTEEVMEAERTLEALVKATENRIDWVLSHPGTSDWLKQSLRGGRERDPVELLNDLEMLKLLLGRWAEAQIERSFSGSPERLPGKPPRQRPSSA